MADLFLGEIVDPAAHSRTGTKVALPSGDLTTHGIIVGMTGSGKTGLGVVLIEECLSAGIPTLLIDPKGDLTNLCLTFPGLAASDFQPWINEQDAQKAGLSVAEFAGEQAKVWSDGLAAWGLGGAQIHTLRDRTNFTIYTPGSSAGVPLDIVGSLAAPTGAIDIETTRDEIEGYVSGLLGLVGIDADPLSSPEHILLANLIESSWTAGKSLDLPTLVGMVAKPPLRRLGVFDLDQFFPPKDRQVLAVRLNGLLASPSFAAWASGQPLDIEALVRTPDGTPRCAIVTTAHLSDEERQFVTTLVLSKVITWMRRQSGTTDLRMLLYMDEVAGYLPPTAAPPSKRPIMTLMKQARAFGVGVVLSTQNPVDIDYKAISNAGTWMIGRLQTERDKARLLDGMNAAAGGVDLAAVGDTIAGLAKREFVLRRAGKDKPEVFTTRWAMSYLRGPLTREQIHTLMAEVKPSAALPPPTGAPVDSPKVAAGDESPVMPPVASGIAVRWVDPAAPWLNAAGGSPTGTRLVPAVVARVALQYDETRADLVHHEEYEAVLTPLSATTDPSTARAVDYDDRDLIAEAPPAGVYVLTDTPLDKKTFFTSLERGLVDLLARSRTLSIQTNRQLKLFSRPGESQELFAARCEQEADARADDETAALRGKYEARARRLAEQLDTARDRIEVLQSEEDARRNSEMAGGLGDVLGGLLGGRSRRTILGKLGTAANRRGRTSTAGKRVDAAENKAESIEDQLQDLEADLAQDLTEIDHKWAAIAMDVTTVPIALERTDVKVTHLVLAWMPTE